MRKMRLDLDGVRVETFDPGTFDWREGTVLANGGDTLNPRSCGGTCILTQICGCGGPTAVDPTCSTESQCG